MKADLPRERAPGIIVPSILDWGSKLETIGWPFIIMEYLEGTLARDNLYDATPDQDTHFLRQMAGIQSHLANLRMPVIGSIIETEGGFSIGPDVKIGLGPFERESEYYCALARHHLARAYNLERLASRTRNGADISFAFLCALNVMEKRDNQTDFAITNADLGPHNLLVDENFNIVAMIDLDFLHAVPSPCVARLPLRTYSELQLDATDPHVRKRTEEYQRALEDLGCGRFISEQQSLLGRVLAELDRQDCNCLKKPTDTLTDKILPTDLLHFSSQPVRAPLTPIQMSDANVSNLTATKTRQHTTGWACTAWRYNTTTTGKESSVRHRHHYHHHRHHPPRSLSTDK